MSSMQIFEANKGTRNEAEATATVLDAARRHLMEHEYTTIEEACAEIQAAAFLANLSLLVFPERETRIRREAL